MLTPEGVTGQEMCELISRYLREIQGIDMTPEQVWATDPEGIGPIVTMYQEAKAWERLNENG